MLKPFLVLLFLSGVLAPYSFADFAATKKLAEQGNADAQYNLGVMYDSGKGVKQSYTQAFKWTEKAAHQGHAAAQYNMGFMYYNGKGELY